MVHWTHDGAPRSERTAAPTALLARLAREVAGPDGEIPDLRVVRPSLEDVYLDLISGDSPARASGAPLGIAGSATDLESIR